MKVLLATHALPPEMLGGVELSVRELALALARAGHAVTVASGTLARSPEETRAAVSRGELRGPRGESVGVVRIARPDLYFDHWHKSLSAAVASAFRELLRELRPEVVHVQHWLRLSRNLVALSAREGIPSVVSLHDAWASCPIVFRVRPDTREACDVPVGPRPCIACAGLVAPRTPWVDRGNAFIRLSERQRDIERELELARVRIVPSAAHARALERTLGREANSLAFEIVPPCAPSFAPRAPRPAAVAARRSLHLVSWSQIARHKGVDVLLEAFLAARERLAGAVDLRLDLHGAEPDPSFAAELRQRSQGAPVHWKGAFSAGQLPEVVDPGAQVFASATRAAESYGLSADEAARLGLALLLPDLPVFVERCAGVALLHAGDARGLAERIVELAQDPALVERSRAAASAWAARLPSNDELARRHAELYARAISAGAPAIAAEDWFAERMATQATLEWDRALSTRTREELGL